MLRPFFEEERDFFKSWFSAHPWELYASNCSTDIYKDKSNVIVEMHVPGMKKEDIDIEVIAHSRLKISSSRKSRKEQEDADFYKKEIRYGSFQQIVMLPAEVESKGATAEINDGVLRIVLPIKECKESGTAKITVQQKK